MRRRDEAGTVAVLLAIIATTLFVIAAMVVNLGLARDVRRTSQGAADAAALAGGNMLYPDGGKCSDLSEQPCVQDAVVAAKRYAESNIGIEPGEWATCPSAPATFKVPTGAPTCISVDSLTKPTKVAVNIPGQPVPMGLGVLAGADESIDVSAHAVAKVEAGDSMPCGLCIIGEGTHDIGNGDAFVVNGDVHFNGSVNVKNNGIVSTNGEIRVENEAQGNSGSYVPRAEEGVGAIADPLAHIPLPPVGMGSLLPKSYDAKSCPTGPGIYGANKINGDVCTLSPGLYVITGEWSFGGKGGSIVGTGVTLYFTCGNAFAPTPCPAAGAQGGALKAAGNGVVSLKGNAPGLDGLTLVYDRNNTSDLWLTGNGSGDFHGAIYAKRAKLLINGNGCAEGYQSMIVTGTIAMNGTNACLKMTYNKDQNPKPLPGGLHLDE